MNNFKLNEKDKTLHCRICGQQVGWEHPMISGLYMLSSIAEGDESKGICYDCFHKDDRPEDEEENK